MLCSIKYVVIVALLASGLAVGCASSPEAETPAEAPAQESPAPAVELPTKDDPLVVDEESGEVRVYAEVNRKWVTEPTRHAVVTAAGSNADKAIFRAGGDALAFNEALVAIGAKAGDNVKKDSPAGTAIEGDRLKITVSWNGKSYDMNDLVLSTGELGGKAIDPRFGGNYEFQKEVGTGCLFCLDSCAAGIASNASVGWKSFDTGKVEFRGNGDLLPSDGTGVVITFSL